MPSPFAIIGNHLVLTSAEPMFIMAVDEAVLHAIVIANGNVVFRAANGDPVSYKPVYVDILSRTIKFVKATSPELETLYEETE